MRNGRAQRRNNAWLAGLSIAAVFAASGCDEHEGTIVGPRGAIVSSADGEFTIEIPEGALETQVDITIEEVECEAENALQACYEVGPVGLPMLKPARVTYEVDAALLEAFPEDLAVFVEREQAWSRLADRDVLTDVGAVSASALYLSSYALVGAPSMPTVNAAAR